MAKGTFALAAIAATALLVAPAAHAQDANLVGSWRAVLNINGAAVEFDLVVQPNMTFSETQQSGGGMTMQTGQIQQTGQNTVTFVVEDWQPRSMPSYSPDPAAGGAIDWHQIPTDKPPGGTWSYSFNGANVLNMHDVYLGGDISYQRVN